MQWFLSFAILTACTLNPKPSNQSHKNFFSIPACRPGCQNPNPPCLCFGFVVWVSGTVSAKRLWSALVCVSLHEVYIFDMVVVVLGIMRWCMVSICQSAFFNCHGQCKDTSLRLSRDGGSLLTCLVFCDNVLANKCFCLWFLVCSKGLGSVWNRWYNVKMCSSGAKDGAKSLQVPWAAPTEQ
jgi:hypothetical protein